MHQPAVIYGITGHSFSQLRRFDVPRIAAILFFCFGTFLKETFESTNSCLKTYRTNFRQVFRMLLSSLNSSSSASLSARIHVISSIFSSFPSSNLLSLSVQMATIRAKQLMFSGSGRTKKRRHKHKLESSSCFSPLLSLAIHLVTEYGWSLSLYDSSTAIYFDHNDKWEG